MVLVNLSLRGEAEGALVWREAAVQQGGGVCQVGGPVGEDDPQGNSPRMPHGHIVVKILPDVNVSSAGGEQKGKELLVLFLNSVTQSSLSSLCSTHPVSLLALVTPHLSQQTFTTAQRSQRLRSHQFPASFNSMI